jgi:hypothetical protein
MNVTMLIVAVVVSAFVVPAPALADTAKTGTWQAATYSGTRGGWRIVQDEGGRYFELTESFEVKSAPDLKIFLSPRAPAELGDKNATVGSVRVAKLTSHKGRARFALPAELDLAKFRSVALHCEKYSVLFAKSAL